MIAKTSQPAVAGLPGCHGIDGVDLDEPVRSQTVAAGRVDGDLQDLRTARESREP
jgi:hypothetical protein